MPGKALASRTGNRECAPGRGRVAAARPREGMHAASRVHGSKALSQPPPPSSSQDGLSRPGLAAPGPVTAVLGPTNTGKTHYALERMLAHSSGMIGLPLRLLAREVYDRVVAVKGAEACALITGEERICPEGARYFVCTVEAMPPDRDVAFLAIDEIQLCADRERGHVFTDRLLHARGRDETLLLGAETVRGLIKTLVPHARFQTRSRFSELSYAGSKKLSRLPRRSAVVAFSAESVYSLAELVRRQRGGAAVVLGALSPRTRNAQVELYQSGDVDFLIATDAIGMGLNMDVDHVAFASFRKFDGQQMRPLRAHEIAQIAGRAGRHTNDGTFGPTGDASALDAEVIEQIETHRFEPVRTAVWRSRALDFANLDALVQSLEVPPPVKALARAPIAVDLAALKALAEDDALQAKLTGPDPLRLLWDVCQVPDFRNVMIDEHVRLLRSLFDHLVEGNGKLPADWIGGHVSRLERTDGEIDTLSSRIAHIRTWTYVANRAQWLDDPTHWQERTRAVEDTLSDALHEALTQRFIDRRTSVLLRRLRQDDDLQSAVDADGEVTVEGEYVGKLQGFRFLADTRASGIDGKALRAAATKALRAMIASRAEQLLAAADTALELTDHGRIWWQGSPVARLATGADGLSPQIVVMADDLLEPVWRDRVERRLKDWLTRHIETELAPLVALKQALEQKPASRAPDAPPRPEAVPTEPGAAADPPAPDREGAPAQPATAAAPAEPAPETPATPELEGLARGIAFQLLENFGVVNRRQIADQVRQLDQPARAALRRFGLRFGEFSLFLPALLKPAQARLLTILWAVHQDRFKLNAPLPTPPTPGLCSVPVETALPQAFYGAAGFRVCGTRAVRVDMLERVADLIRAARQANRKTDADKSPPAAAPGAPSETPPSEQNAAPHAPAASEAAAPPPSADAPAPETPAPAPSSAPSPEAAAPKSAAPALPPGAFLAGPEMMSLVGCSGDDFESILRALGFRPVTVHSDAADALTAWRPAGRGQGGDRNRRPGHKSSEGGRPTPRKDGGARGTAKGKGGPPPKRNAERQNENRPKRGKPPGKGGKPPRDGGKSRQPAAREFGPGKSGKGGYDPDSPFAALAQLKETLKR